MKLMLEVQLSDRLRNDDILEYRNGVWVNIPKREYLADLTNKITELENDIETLQVESDDFKSKVNMKLEQYHKVLQNLTKRGK